MDSSISIPENLYLSQNYPNPFNPISTIKYGIPNRDNIDISLYDLNGRKIKTFINTIHQEGHYELTITSDNLNSGLYLIKIISSDGAQSRKITVLK